MNPDHLVVTACALFDYQHIEVLDAQGQRLFSARRHDPPARWQIELQPDLAAPVDTTAVPR